MRSLFYGLSFIFSKFVPVGIILSRHLVEDEGGWNLELLAIVLLTIIIYFAFLKPMGEKIQVWEYQGVNSFFVQNYKKIRTILAVGLFWWVWSIMVADYNYLNETITYVFFSLVIGLIFINVSLAFEEEGV